MNNVLYDCARKSVASSASLSIATWLFTSISAHAGGLYLQEFLDTYQGAANAGAQALGTNPSTVFHNPAAMSRLEGRQLSVAAGALYADVKFAPSPTTPVTGGDGGQQGGLAPALSFFYTNKLNNRWTTGVGVYSVSGASLDPDNTWVGRFQMTEIELLTLNVTGAVSYRINDAWSIGATAGLIYGKLDLDLNVPGPLGGEASINLDGDDVRPLAVLGVHYEPNDQWRFGLSVFSGFEADFGGALSIVGTPLAFSTDTALDFPPTIRAAFAYQATPQLTLMGSLGYERWSDLDNLYVSTARGTGALAREWDDTHYASLGFQYQANSDLMLQAGIAYDSSPVDPEFRTADAAIDEQIRVAVGAEYQIRDNLKMRGSLMYIDLGDAPINSGTLIGDYRTNRVFVASFGLHYTLGPRQRR